MTPDEARFRMALEAIASLPIDGFFVAAKNIARLALEGKNGIHS